MKAGTGLRIIDFQKKNVKQIFGIQLVTRCTIVSEKDLDYIHQKLLRNPKPILLPVPCCFLTHMKPFLTSGERVRTLNYFPNSSLRQDDILVCPLQSPQRVHLTHVILQESTETSCCLIHHEASCFLCRNQKSTDLSLYLGQLTSITIQINPGYLYAHPTWWP